MTFALIASLTTGPTGRGNSSSDAVLAARQRHGALRSPCAARGERAGPGRPRARLGRPAPAAVAGAGRSGAAPGAPYVQPGPAVLSFWPAVSGPWPAGRRSCRIRLRARRCGLRPGRVRRRARRTELRARRSRPHAGRTRPRGPRARPAGAEPARRHRRPARGGERRVDSLGLPIATLPVKSRRNVIYVFCAVLIAASMLMAFITHLPSRYQARHAFVVLVRGNCRDRLQRLLARERGGFPCSQRQALRRGAASAGTERVRHSR